MSTSPTCKEKSTRPGKSGSLLLPCSTCFQVPMKDFASSLGLLCAVEDLPVNCFFIIILLFFFHLILFSFTVFRSDCPFKFLLVSDVLSWSCHTCIFNGSSQKRFWKLWFFSHTFLSPNICFFGSSSTYFGTVSSVLSQSFGKWSEL